MALTKDQKLASIATTPKAGDFHVEPFPKLSELTMGYGFKQGNTMFDEAMEAWRVNLEKSVNQIIRDQAGDTG